MEKKIELTYYWDLSDYPEVDDDGSDHKTREQLQEHAEERIFEMRKEGYTSGELHFENNVISVHGSWSFSYTG